MRTCLATGVVAATALALTSCAAGAGGDSAPGPGDVSLVATTTPLGSVTSQIAECAGGTSLTLMPVNADPHDFSASSAQVADLARADLVIANGLGLEGGLHSALEQIEADGTEVLDIAERVDPLPWGEGDHEGHEGHSHGEFDPHFWLDAARMAEAAQLIGDTAVELTGDGEWARCGTEVSDELRSLDTEIRDTLSVIPEERRILVSDHEAIGYFNAAYDFRSGGVVIPGGSTEAQPSSRELADLAADIREQNIPVIFSSATTNQALVEAVAAEAGEGVQVVPLHQGSVGPEGSAAADYQGMMRENARLIVDALGGESGLQ